MILKVKTPPNFWTIFDKSSLRAATDADFDRRSRLQTRRTFAQQKPKRKWGPDAMCHEKRMTLCICLFCDKVQWADLTCDVIRKVALFVLSKL